MVASPLGMGRIGQIAMRALDLDRAIAFYRDILALPFLYRFGNLAFFDCAGTRLLIEVPPSAEFDHPGSLIYFDVADIQQSWQQLVERGITIVDPPHIVGQLAAVDIWMAFFRDSEGNMLALMSEVTRAAS